MKRQEGDRGGGVHHRLVAEQRLAREGRDDLRDHAERRQDHDVDLGVPEEPEDVLEHHRVAAAGRVEEAGGEELVGQQHGHRAGQHRHHRDQQERGDQPGPAEDRHLQQVHARRAHVEDGGDDVDRAHDRADAHHVDGEDREGHVVAALQRQRRIQRPAAGGAAARQEQGQQQQANANGRIQNDQLFMRGSAMSGAPICSGIIQLARPTKAGITPPKIITSACMVVIWLKNSG
jgi:hypothetical protein